MTGWALIGLGIAMIGFGVAKWPNTGLMGAAMIVCGGVLILLSPWFPAMGAGFP